MAGFFAIFLLIGGISQYLFRSVTDLYTESVHGRLEERALQYKKSFIFKMNSDIQNLRGMACILENIQPENIGELLSSLWDASQMMGFVRLAYFAQDGESIQLTAEGQITAIQADEEAAEMQYGYPQGLDGNFYCFRPFYYSVLGNNT